MAEETDIIEIHTGESKSWKWNPKTHQKVTNETPDGSIIETVYPLEEEDART